MQTVTTRTWPAITHGEYQDEVLEVADSICREDLGADPFDAALLHLLGLLAARKQRLLFALACLRRAVAQQGDCADYLADLAEGSAASGHARDALAAWLGVLKLRPLDPEPYCRIAGALAGQGYAAEAIATCDAALRLDATRSWTHVARGDALARIGRLSESKAAYDTAARLAPEDVDIHGRRARLRLRDGDVEGALAIFEEGVRRWPMDADLRVGMAKALVQCKRLEHASSLLRATLRDEPSHAEAARWLAWTLDARGRERDASAAWCCYGAALETRDAFPRAARAYRRAITRQPHSVRVLMRQGHVHLAMARPDLAFGHFDAARTLVPDLGDAHVGAARALHLLGDVDKGWRDFAYYTPGGYDRPFGCPMWDGSAMLGQTILLWSDQGLGDTIQYLRHVPVVRSLTGRVVVQTRANLVPLIQGMPCIDRVIPFDVPLPHFDVHAPLFALPRLLHARHVATPHRVPYLEIDPARRRVWASRLGRRAEACVGLVWGTEPTWHGARFKRASLATFAPLARVLNVRFISLQLGDQSAELFVSPPALRIERLLTESCSIADTAALILNLDLVISVDTMVAHLAGALAVPVWILLHTAPDWRWSLNGSESPWYPTMRIFRQSRMGDWSNVVADVAERLRARERPALNARGAC